MTRLYDWQSRLNALMAERLVALFVWGRNDCAIFACDCVLVQTGRDPAEGLRGYRDAKEATVVLRNGGGLAQIADDRLGWALDPLMAQVGDVGLCKMNDRPTLVVCGGGHWVGPGEHGLISVPMHKIIKAWRT